MKKAVQCSYTIAGPKLGYRLVAWHRRCKKLTKHESGYCDIHRAGR